MSVFELTYELIEYSYFSISAIHVILQMLLQFVKSKVNLLCIIPEQARYFKRVLDGPVAWDILEVLRINNVNIKYEVPGI